MAMQKAAAKLGHLDRTSGEPREKKLLPVDIVGIENANEKIRLLKLALREGPSKFLAGQWLDTFVPDNSKPGGFTIASAPSAAAQTSAPYLELAVQEAPENPAAAWLWKPPHEILGKSLDVRVGGSFICPPTEGLEGVKRIVLVAGGVGINPLMSILGYLADEREKLDIEVSLMYGTKVPEDGNLSKILFLERIADLFRRGRVPGNAKLFLSGSASHADDSVGGQSHGMDIKLGRMTKGDLVAEVRAGGCKESTLVYVCGPPAMTDNFVDTLTAPEMASVINAANVKSEKWW